MIVLDASAAVALALGLEGSGQISDRVFDGRSALHAPHLIDLEVAQSLRRYVLRGEAGPRRARKALSDFGDLSLTRYPHDVLLPRVWQLRGNLTAYDAAYVALAEMLSAPLLTRDARLARAGGHRAIIELI